MEFVQRETPKESVKNAADFEDCIPERVLVDLESKRRFIYWGLFFLAGAVMWAYYSMLTAQFYYGDRFPSYKFAFLTTFCLKLPLSLGYMIQMWGGLHSMLGDKNRMIIGFGGIFLATTVIIFIGLFKDSISEDFGAITTLIMFGVCGASHSLAEPVMYKLAGLFPDERFTTGVQVGDSLAGVINTSIGTIIRLAVGGLAGSNYKEADELSFYIFMGILLIISVMAVMIFNKLTELPSAKYFLERAAADEAKHTQRNLTKLWAKFFRVGKVILLPMIAQYLLFFCTLAYFPGIGFSTGSVVGSVWYGSPGVIGMFSVGDLVGRMLCMNQSLFKMFSMKMCFIFSVMRWLWLPLFLMGLYSSPLYAFQSLPAGQDVLDSISGLVAWELFNFFLFGCAGGFFATITIGNAPLMVAQEDREAASQLMVMALYLGLSSGASLGYVIGENHLFGV
jgi:equilibrative nucleoside transporter 1/2/3